MTGVLRRRGESIETHREEGPVKMEAEIRVILPGAKECSAPGPPESERGKKGFFPTAFGGSVALLTC